jgi:two-component system KDP operon response regulator KdpE
MSDPMSSVVIIEDDAQIRRFLRTALGAQGFRIHEAASGQQGLVETATRKPDILILDLGLPDIDGVQVVRELRAWTTLPIIVLSARSQEDDKIAALDAGADDYLTKPFGVGELIARIRVALRHRSAGVKDGADGIFTVADVKIDLGRRQVFVADCEVHLTPIEYRLLALLIQHAGRVVTHRQLLKEVWGPSYVENSHYLRVYMGALRHKLEADPTRPRFLLTEAGVGYRLSPDEK